MRLHNIVVAAILGASLARAAFAAPVQWPVSAGGNNHFYELVAPPSGITWTDAQIDAATSSVYGVAGHLVAISDVAEWNFIVGQFPRDWTWIGFTDQGQEGNFKWVTNEPVTFTRWIPGEPNNAGPEHYVFYQQSTALGGAFGWNDYRNVPSIIGEPLPIAYVREFDTVPEPSSWALLALGCAAAAVFNKRLLGNRRGPTR